MASITLAADSTTLVLNGYAFTSLAEGDYIELNPVNELTSHVNDSNGGVTIKKRSDGDVHDLVVRVQRFGDDDIFLNSSINTESPTVFNGSMKENFIKDSSDGVESFVLENGSITVRPSLVKNSQEGNAMTEYTIRFRNAQRNL